MLLILVDVHLQVKMLLALNLLNLIVSIVHTKVSVVVSWMIGVYRWTLLCLLAVLRVSP